MVVKISFCGIGDILGTQCRQQEFFRSCFSITTGYCNKGNVELLSVVFGQCL